MKTIITLVGKAGSGKDTIAAALAKALPHSHFIVSCTTRPPREGEVDGVNYHYLTDDEFISKIENGDILEHAMFRGWYYGTSKEDLIDGLNIGVHNLDGYKQLSMKHGIQLIGFKIECDDKTRLLRQLNREENPDCAEIVRRFGTDELDFGRKGVGRLGLITVNNGKDANLQDVVDEILRYLHDVGCI